MLPDWLIHQLERERQEKEAKEQEQLRIHLPIPLSYDEFPEKKPEREKEYKPIVIQL